MICRPKQRGQVYIVDAHPNDYNHLARETHQQGTDLVFFRSGREALRSNPDYSPAMWVVNLQLPDMRGTDLQAMLRTRGSLSPVIMIGDQYCVDDEINARSAGAALYFVKPIHAGMLFATC